MERKDILTSREKEAIKALKPLLGKKIRWKTPNDSAGSRLWFIPDDFTRHGGAAATLQMTGVNQKSGIDSGFFDCQCPLCKGLPINQGPHRWEEVKE